MKLSIGQKNRQAYAVLICCQALLLACALVALSSCGGSASQATPPCTTCNSTPPVQGWGLLSNGQRDKTLWPFASDSIWNTAIGSGAAYSPANISVNSAGGSPTVFVQDEDVIVMAPSSPLTNVYYNGAAWTGGDRCVQQGAVIAQVPFPSDFTLGNSLDNNSAAFLMPDNETVAQNQPFTRCAAGGPATTLVAFPDTSIYDEGPYGAHGGSGLSALGGTIRLGEFPSGRIHHVMKVELYAAQYYYCCTTHWPAVTIDDYADPVTYGGTDPNLGPGSLLALPPNFDVTQMTTVPGQILAQAFKDYGAYVVDDTFWNAWTLDTEQGPNGRVVDEFSTLYGFPMSAPAQGSPFMNDVTNIFESLNVVTNNGATAVGGGGTPRIASPPPIGN
jgi:hypothetical protein